MKKKLFWLIPFLIIGIFLIQYFSSVQHSNNEHTIPGVAIADNTDDIVPYKVSTNRPIDNIVISGLSQVSDFEGQLSETDVIVRTTEQQVHKINELPFVSATEKYTPFYDNSNDKNSERFVITLFSAADNKAITSKIVLLGGQVLDGGGELGRSLLVEIPVAALHELKNNPQILYIEKYTEPSFLNDRVRDIIGAGALAVKGFISTEGLTGQGQMLALADSGLDTGNINDLHPDLRNDETGKSKVIMLKSWAGLNKPADTIGHGTHMAGTMVGSGKASNGKYAGVAPGARLIFQGIVNDKGQVAPPVNIEEIFQPAYTLGARVHVNGWGRDENKYGSASAQIDSFIWNHPAFLAVFSAGNAGSDNGAEQGTITAEANSKNALVVGASASPRPAFDATNTDTLLPADFSSRGPACDGRIKPELLAPGTSIISASSRVLEGNLPGRPMYTRMQGTSMAAAVAGGAAALLREFLADNGYESPSSALIKSLLINGARVSESGPGQEGFGVLDLAGTVLSVKEKSMLFEDNTNGLKNIDTVTYKYNVANRDSPFKATLGWVDPPALPGAKTALVNNLDLVVTAPDGKQYYGNDFIKQGKPDNQNNVEQVYITNPVPGTYVIKVTGSRIIKGTVKLPDKQDYAIAYGQTLPSSVVETDSEVSGISHDKPVHYELNGRLITDANSRVYPGTRFYTGKNDVYLVGRYWHTSGITARNSSQGLLFTELEPELREGGYCSIKDAITVNGQTWQGSVKDLPPGVDIRATYDPLTQKLWLVNLFYTEVSGVVSSVDEGMTKLKLVDNPKEYQLSKNMSVIYKDNLKDTDPIDISFGSHGEINKILPGMIVKLVLSPITSEVYCVILQREVTFGRAASVDNNEITLENGKKYVIMPGIPVVKEKSIYQITDIKADDFVTALLLPGTNKIIGLTAYSNVVYGKITQYSAKEKSIYVKTLDNKVQLFKITPHTDIYRWGQQADVASITGSPWVRVIADGDAAEIMQLDVAESLPVENKVFASYDEGSKTIRTMDGNTFYTGIHTGVIKDGLPVPSQELVAGDKMELSLLVYDMDDNVTDKVVLGIITTGKTTVEKPYLKVSTVPFADRYWVVGQTDAARLYWWGEKGFTEIKPDKEEFSFVYDPKKSGPYATLVAVGQNGAVTGLEIDLAGKNSVALKDLDQHWARVDLMQMAGEGLIAGYGDGTYKPDNPISRVEFTALLSRAFGWYSAGTSMPAFNDRNEIPAWARESIAGAVERKVVVGYPDGSFKPDALLTRQEECAILARLIKIYGVDVADSGDLSFPFKDVNNISPWALPSVQQLYAMGIVKGRTVDMFIASAHATRAETAVTVYRLLQLIRDKQQAGVVN